MMIYCHTVTDSKLKIEKFKQSLNENLHFTT